VKLKHKQGEEGEWCGFTSMTRDKGVAMQFVKNDENGVVSGTIITAYRFYGYDISAFSDYIAEEEVIVEPFQHFIVMSCNCSNELVDLRVDYDNKTKMLLERINPSEQKTSVDFDGIGEDLVRRALEEHSKGEHDNAVELLCEAMNFNSQIACFNLGNCYLTGVGVVKDIEVGFHFWKKAGTISDADCKRLRALSNGEIVNARDLDLRCLFTTEYHVIPEDFRALYEVLKLFSMTSLTLENNGVGYLGVPSLSEVLKTNSSLSSLDLSSNDIDDSGAFFLSEALAVNSSLTQLYMWENNISDSGVSFLSEALKVNSSISLLDLAGNKVSDSGACSLSEALNVNSSLTQLNLWETFHFFPSDLSSVW